MTVGSYLTIVTILTSVCVRVRACVRKGIAWVCFFEVGHKEPEETEHEEEETPEIWSESSESILTQNYKTDSVWQNWTILQRSFF